ncbi:tRNA (guanosine(37)-N1)-methyltransferase TrmD [Corynebacterium durum]|uniref:tRNA (guanosine(37)-N1)-methyltransferase TrmD n=1 Tax=Corynebacterium durum TaxID=61592 RepID=UPI0026DAF0AF|nr:tRNA (guanosine(37)-N1)-methyltransferase TrmD [Corynebacterium durum]MDO4651858.1 tRNA (guanosine(37)-N1)-methyltransferase TrmD [Corynebacterium durum]
MRLDVITIFPEYLDPLRHALLGKAIEKNILQVGVHNLRDWATDVHKSVDDTPYGGGPGMVMKPEVWGPALDDIAVGVADAPLLESAQPHLIKSSDADVHGGGDQEGVDKKPLLIVPTPAGKPFTQDMARAWSAENHIVFACGRYEGIDQRVIDDAARNYRVEEVSIGDYVLIGGEVAVLVIAEAIVRLIPGVLGNTRSHEEDSFSDGLLEGPSYTKPRTWRGHSVPDVLFSGNHALVDRWRRDQSLLRTASRRPDLIDALRASGGLNSADESVLDKIAAARPVRVSLNVLLTPAEWVRSQALLPDVEGFTVESVDAEEMSGFCEAENMLVAQYQQLHGQSPVVEVVHRIEITGTTTLSDRNVTRAVVDSAFPEGALWYGTTIAE